MIGRRIDRAVARAQRSSERKQEAEERNRRGRERQFLAMQMGLRMLNDLEREGCFCISDYTRIRPKSVINAWVNLIDDYVKRRRR